MLGRNPEVVSWWIAEGVRRRLAEPGFAARLVELDRALAESFDPGELDGFPTAKAEPRGP